MNIKNVARSRLLTRGFLLEYATQGWNVVGYAVREVRAIFAGHQS